MIPLIQQVSDSVMVARDTIVDTLIVGDTVGVIRGTAWTDIANVAVALGLFLVAAAAIRAENSRSREAAAAARTIAEAEAAAKAYALWRQINSWFEEGHRIEFSENGEMIRWARRPRDHQETAEERVTALASYRGRTAPDISTSITKVYTRVLSGLGKVNTIFKEKAVSPTMENGDLARDAMTDFREALGELKLVMDKELRTYAS